MLHVIFNVLVFSANTQEQTKSYYNTRQLISMGSYYESTSNYDVKDGEWKYYYENGQLKSIGSHKRLCTYKALDDQLKKNVVLN